VDGVCVGRWSLLGVPRLSATPFAAAKRVARLIRRGRGPADKENSKRLSFYSVRDNLFGLA